MMTRGPRLNSLMPRPGSLGDDAANRERAQPDGEPVADRDVQRRQKFRPDEHAVVRQQRVRIRLPALELDGAVERKARLDGPQLGHLRHLP